MQVLQLAQHAATLVEAGTYAWSAVSVWGWEDSPVAWEGMERSAAHAVGVQGDACSHYSMVFMEGGGVLVTRSLGATDFALPAKTKKGGCKGHV